MINFISHSPEAIIAALHAEQNSIEDDLREQTLSESLLKDYVRYGKSSTSDHFSEFSELTREFMDEKRGLNMGQRFELALKPKYFDKIHVVELGLTKEPGQEGEIDGLKDQYGDLKAWLQKEGIIEDELPREASGRTIEFGSSEITSDRRVVIRNRPLISATIPVPEAHIAIIKRMVFSLPTSLLEQLARMAEGMATEPADQIEQLNRCIEKALELKNPGIDAIRTGYYLIAHKL